MIEKPLVLNLETKLDERGLLAFANLPFPVKRFYSISNNVDNLPRGNHAHKKLQQIFLCAGGSLTLKLKTPIFEVSYNLTPWSGLIFVPAGHWRVLDNFSTDAVCLVFASAEFDELDYIHDFSEYEKWFIGVSS
jgi:WxcM-like, C-terminal